MLPAGSYPTTSSPEYVRTYSLAQMGAATAFAYANGAGVTLAVIDDGVNGAASELTGRVSADSTDLYGSRNRPGGDAYAASAAPNHGTLIADVAAANFNGFGTVGVAYGSTILAVRADRAGCTDASGCFFDTDLAIGIDYAVAHGARVINLSIGGDAPDGARFESALKRAVDAGLVVTIAAGNGGDPDPDYPARYAADPRYAGAVVAVGATNSARALAGFSNKAGSAAEGFLAAPGDNFITACEPGGSCWQVSGTSFAAPQVAGALALLLQAFPNLTGRQALDILLRTASDLGAAGTDAVFGRGLVNLAAAFSPLGALSVADSKGAVALAADLLAAGSGSPALADALVGAPLATVGHDSYNRQFRVDLGRAFPQGGPQVLVGSPAVRLSRSETRTTFAGGEARLSLASADSPWLAPAALRPDLLAADPARAVGADLTLGPLSLAAGRGRAGAPLAGTTPANAFQNLTAANWLTGAHLQLGAWSLAVERAGAEPAWTLESLSRPGSSYEVLVVSRQAPAWRASLSAGRLYEPSGLLGADMPQSSPYLMPGRTRFAALSLEADFGDRLSLSAGVSGGITQAPGRLLSLERGYSSSWRVALESACSQPLCRRFSLSLSQPLRLEKGWFAANLAETTPVYEPAPRFVARRFSAAPTGRELDLAASLVKSLPQGGGAGVSAVLAVQPGSRRDAAPAWGLSVFWKRRF